SATASPDSSGDAAPDLDLPDPVRAMENFAPFTAHDEDAHMPPPPHREALRSLYGNGFQWASADDEFVLQYNNFTMVDGRLNAPRHQSLISDGVNIPLALNTLSGRATRLVEGTYTFGSSFAEPGSNTLKTVFAYITVPLDDRFNIRIGRQRIP